MTSDKQYWAFKCHTCKRWQLKEKRMYGKEINNAVCIYCETEIKLNVNGKLMDLRTAQSVVMQKNKEQDTAPPGTLEFRTYKPKGE